MKIFWRRWAAVYSQMHPEDRKRFLDFYDGVETGKRGISKGRCVFVPERRTNGIVSSNVMVTNYKPEENEIEINGVSIMTLQNEVTGRIDSGTDSRDDGSSKSAFLPTASHEIRTAECHCRFLHRMGN